MLTPGYDIAKTSDGVSTDRDMIVAWLRILGSSGPCGTRWGPSPRMCRQAWTAEAEDHTKDKELSIIEQLRKWDGVSKGRMLALGNSRGGGEGEPLEKHRTCAACPPCGLYSALGSLMLLWIG